ncbi:MAG: hypothetical protein AUJ07_03335 [Crenarchaeota archaeon 13_1_40CM_3_53_5]|nr:MAG: hypothetical protein AUJ07_03335 [Crenarchaeota archaeon 13_1_40CM_3_53_5]
MVPVLSVGFGISSASIATYLYLGMKRIRTSQEGQFSIRNRVHPRKTSRHTPHPSTSQPRVVDLPQVVPAKLKPITPPQGRVHTQKPAAKERENTSTPETEK